MKNNTQVMELLKDLKSKKTFNDLIEIVYRIALAYLHFNHLKVYKILQNEDLSIEEFALDTIAPLFIKDKLEQNISIYTTFKSWQPPVKTEEDALYFLNKIVASRVEQHIYSLLREEDPFFSKILNSINYLIKSQGYIKIQSYGMTYIVKSDYEICDTEFFDRQDFVKIPTHLFSDKKNLISNLLDYIESETIFAAAIPLNYLIYRLKEINFSEYAFTDISETNRKQFEMDEIVNLALTFSLDKLNNSYCATGKLSITEGESIKRALVDICEDLKNGGVNPGLQNYLSPYIKDLSKEAYKKNYHNIFEYLFKVTKSEIANNLLGKK